MKKYLMPVHFINGEETFEEFEKGVENIKAADDISKTYNLGLEFGLKLTTTGKKLSKDLENRIFNLRRSLPKDLVLLYDPVDRGGGMSWIQAAFNPTFSEGMVIVSCLDQYIINSRESLEQIMGLAQKVEKDNLLYGIGSRDVPVILATNKRNSDLRIIHELFHSLTIGSDKLRVQGTTPENVTPAYAEIGESTTGLEIINHTSPQYPDLSKNLLRVTQAVDRRGNSMVYYCALKTHQLGEVATGYVSAMENPFPEGKKNLEVEYQFVTQKVIGHPTAQLRKTDMAGHLFDSLKKPEHTDRISEFYPKEDVELVRDLMIENLVPKSRD